VSILVFDVVSFVAGVAAGALTAGLAGLLHALEKTADIQEKVLMAKRKADQLTSMLSTSGAANSGISKPEVDELQRDLDEIQAEIKRMYKKTKH
jgi:gas vesicle protein